MSDVFEWRLVDGRSGWVVRMNNKLVAGVSLCEDGRFQVRLREENWRPKRYPHLFDNSDDAKAFVETYLSLHAPE